MRIVATTSLPAVDCQNADHWNAERPCQEFQKVVTEHRHTDTELYHIRCGSNVWVHVSSFKSNLSPSLVVVLVLTNNNLLSSLLAMASSSSPGTSCTDKSHGPESGWSSGYHKSYVIVDHGDHGDHHLGPHPPSQHHLVHPPVPPYLSSLHINTVLLLCMLYQCSHHPSLTW